MKKNQVRMAASLLVALVTILGTPSRVFAQAAQASPVRACILRYLQAPTVSTCTTLDAFRQATAAFDECRAAPSEPMSRHFCGVCVFFANRVPTGCEPYQETAVAPWAPSVAPLPIVVPPPPPQPSAADMDAAVAPVVDATVPDAVPPPVIQTVQAVNADAGAGFAVVIAPSPDGGSGTVVLNAEMQCRIGGGYYDATARLPMEHGRIQQGVCYTVEMQALARAQTGMAENTPPDQILARIRNTHFVQESRLQEVAAHLQTVESERRLALVQEITADQRRLNRQIEQLSIRDRQRQREQENFRRNFGFDLQIFGGGSIFRAGGSSPFFFGIGADFVLPIGARVAGVIGVGLGAGFPLDGRSLPQYQIFERVGVRYYHPFVGGASPGFGVGIAAYQQMNARDFHLQAQSFGGYLEGFIRFAVGPLRFRVGLMGIIGPGSRESAIQSTSITPDVTFIGTIGPEFRL